MHMSEQQQQYGIIHSLAERRYVRPINEAHEQLYADLELLDAAKGFRAENMNRRGGLSHIGEIIPGVLRIAEVMRNTRSRYSESCGRAEGQLSATVDKLQPKDDE